MFHESSKTKHITPQKNTEKRGRTSVVWNTIRNSNPIFQWSENVCITDRTSPDGVQDDFERNSTMVTYVHPKQVLYIYEYVDRQRSFSWRLHITEKWRWIIHRCVHGVHSRVKHVLASKKRITRLNQLTRLVCSTQFQDVFKNRQRCLNSINSKKTRSYNELLTMLLLTDLSSPCTP